MSINNSNNNSSYFNGIDDLSVARGGGDAQSFNGQNMMRGADQFNSYGGNEPEYGMGSKKHGDSWSNLNDESLH